MSLCLNPDCSHKNTPTDKFCHKCGSQLLLRERYRALKLIGQGGFGKTFQAIDEDKPSKPYCVNELPRRKRTGYQNQNRLNCRFWCSCRYSLSCSFTYLAIIPSSPCFPTVLA
ncbi:4-Cys prefix domain-containing protein [Microcystis sp. LEGE 00066]|uniref:4-Cys prefix domain-containing protein n=1 Tax=Microcystis sp. LEGE 00066 TaxID=1828685 RepID=UPI00351C5609